MAEQIREMAKAFAKKIKWAAEEGATAVEYGLMVALIAAVIIGAVTALGSSTQGCFNKVADAVGTPATATAGNKDC